MLEFTPHFSGSSGNFYVISDGGYSLAIECGVRFADIQRATGYTVTQLDGCCISHAHGDHSRSVKDMVKSGVDCYASDQTWMDLQFSSHRTHSLIAKQSVTIKDRWVVTPFDLVHDAPGCFGFLIDGPSGGRLCYVSDTCYSPYRFENVTIFAIEANHDEDIIRANADEGVIDAARFARTSRTHMSIQRAELFLDACDLSKVKHIFLLHLSSENSDAAAFETRIKRRYGVPTTVAAAASRLTGGVR